MNTPTAMLLAAAGASNYDQNTWVQLRLSQMTSTLPAQDPDGVFVSLTETAAGWVPVLNYNGAGGVNDGISEMVGWLTADLGSVIPGRTGQNWSNTVIPEFISRPTAIPADTAAWQPIATAGAVANNTTTTSMGIYTHCTSATQVRAGVAPPVSGLAATASTTAVAAAKGLIWWQLPLTAAGVVSLRQNGGTVIVTPSSALTVTTALTVTSSQFFVGIGNGVINPAAGNRSITVRFYTRVLSPTFTNISAPTDATGWTAVSPASFGTPGTPASDPNALLSSFDTSAYPEWRPTIDDTGLTGPFDGYDEGIRWDATSLLVDPEVPSFTCLRDDFTNSAYAATQQYSFSAGISDPSTGPGMGGNKYVTAGTTRQANVMQFNTNATGASTASALGSTSLYYPSADGTTTAGTMTISVNLTAAGAPTGTSALVSRANALTGPRFSVSSGKDTSFLGTTAVAFRFLVWFATFPDYTNDWPA